jgi:formylglycine-generating enzyme required for sulfatase activity
MTDPSPDALCPGCFAEKGGANPCPHCGYDEQAPRGPLLLPHRTLLHEQFLVGRVLGKPGGFGITYLGWDLKLQTQVAIKEFLPRELASRATDQASVAPHSQDEGALFRYGLEQFLREARTLAQLDHPNIVRVRHFFEANGTAYLVMDYYEGISLAEHLDNQGGRLPEESAKQLLLPILDGLRAVHAKGFLHRDVKPQNIYLARTDTGGVRPILLDFGAARQAMGERSRSLSVVVSAGYAPFEQYQRKGTQGPWTDIYAAAAVLYRAVTGEEPPEATDRISADELKPAADFGVSKGLSDALHEALAIAPEARPRSVQEFQARLWGDRPPPSPPHPTPVPPPPDPPPPPTPVSPGPSPPSSGRPWWIVPAVLAPLLAVGAWYLYREPTEVTSPEHIAREVRSAPKPPTPPPVARLAFEPELVHIDGGCFQMGSPPSEEGRDDDERQHRVCVEDFAIGKYEVTQAQWEAVMGSNPSHFNDCADCPVERVSWNDVQDYIAKLNERTGKQYRLPTEAQWEYAARAGTQTPFWSGECIHTDQANYDGNYDYNGCGAKTGVYCQKTLPVGSLEANPWGLYDVLGNVWEWTCSLYDKGYGGAESKCAGKNEAGSRSLRGGSWGGRPPGVRAAFRSGTRPATRYGDIGFRLAQD